MLDLNAPAPPFTLEGAHEGRLRRFSLSDFRQKWVILFFYPADFTFVCPTEVVGFSRRLVEFEALEAQVLGISADDVETHHAWSAELGGVAVPLLSDTAREVCRAYEVLNPAEQRAWRATIIVSPEGKIAYQVVSPMNVGRSVEETLRVLRALATGRLCPADWQPGQPTLDPDLRY